MKQLKIALDIDGVLANFYLAMCIKFDKKYIMIDRWEVPWIEKMLPQIDGDMEFWNNLPNMNYPEAITFDFDYYITAIPEKYAQSRINWLKRYGYPDKPIVFASDKAEAMKNYEIDVLIDDKYENINEVTEAGFIGIHYIPNYLEPMLYQIHDKDLTIKLLSDANPILEDIQQIKYNPNVMTLEKAKNMKEGTKVIFIPEGKIYEFGYIGKTGRIIIYNEGERNMQDSYACKPATLEIIPDLI